MKLQFSARSSSQEDYLDPSMCGLAVHSDCVRGNGSLSDPFLYEICLENTSKEPFLGVFHTELCAEASGTSPQFFLPGFLYGTNRGDTPIKVDNKYPRLRPGKPELPASPFWMVRSDRLSHPAAFLYLPVGKDRRCGHLYGLTASPWLVKKEGNLMQPGEPGQDGAAFGQFTGFSCSLDHLSVGYTLGYENAPWLFIQSHNIKDRAPLSEKNSILLPARASVCFSLRVYDLEASDVRILYSSEEEVYRLWHQTPRSGVSVPEAAEDLMLAVSRYAWLPKDRNYSGFVRENKDGSLSFNRIFSISWTGGLSAAVPVLMAALRLGDETAHAQALSCIDNIVQNSQNPCSGLPFETWDAENGWSCRGWWYDGMHNGGHSGYLDGQTVYYILKAYELEKKFSHREHRDWLSFARHVLQHLHAQRNSDGEYAYVLSEETGAGIEYDAMGSCWGLAAEALFARITGEDENLGDLKESEAHYYRAFVQKGICYGAPLDTDKTVDSEGVLSYIRAVRFLHEITGDPVLLDHLRDALCYEYSFKLCYNTPVQTPPLSAIGWSSCGGSITSVANPHIHPMSSTVIDEMLYYLQFREDSYIRSRLSDTVLWSLQTFNTFDGEYGYGHRGWMSERFCHCEGLLVEKYPDGSPASTWFALMPWACGSILEGICGELWENIENLSAR